MCFVKDHVGLGLEYPAGYLLVTRDETLVVHEKYFASR